MPGGIGLRTVAPGGFDGALGSQAPGSSTSQPKPKKPATCLIDDEVRAKNVASNHLRRSYVRPSSAFSTSANLRVLLISGWCQWNTCSDLPSRVASLRNCRIREANSAASSASPASSRIERKHGLIAGRGVVLAIANTQTPLIDPALIIPLDVEVDLDVGAGNDRQPRLVCIEINSGATHPGSSNGVGQPILRHLGADGLQAECLKVCLHIDGGQLNDAQRRAVAAVSI